MVRKYHEIVGMLEDEKYDLEKVVMTKDYEARLKQKKKKYNCQAVVVCRFFLKIFF